MLAEALLATGDRPVALSQLRQALREEPDHLDARHLLKAVLSDPKEIARTANQGLPPTSPPQLSAATIGHPKNALGLSRKHALGL